ncbi:hypothetical protein GOODEAATRI_029630 [Goodea atripinnis]|uniref:Uncharacterized protein n=1 Tax=Goodea atripinnis TaxID=208336 RepID=A0ABV0NYW0_9TELE
MGMKKETARCLLWRSNQSHAGERQTDAQPAQASQMPQTCQSTYFPQTSTFIHKQQGQAWTHSTVYLYSSHLHSHQTSKLLSGRQAAVECHYSLQVLFT